MIECVIQRNISKAEKAVRILLMIMTFFLGLVGALTVILLPAFFVALLATRYYGRRLRDEYEYGYNPHTGNLNISCIINGAKRKTRLDTYVEQVRRICPYGQCGAVKAPGVKPEDYASRRAEAKVYVIELAGKGGRSRYVIFEPSDEMMEAMHQRCPDRVQLREE